MKHSLSVAIAVASLTTTAAYAEIDFYGKANVALELVSLGTEDHVALESNASRVGVKGSETVSDNLSAIYQLEYEVKVDDSNTFAQRNIYVGLKGGFGSVIAGHFDTPFKKSQNEVDLFNDLHGDIKTVLTRNEYRASNSVMYVSPTIAGGVQIYLDYISSEVEEVDGGKSLAVTYTIGDLYLAVAADVDVALVDTQALRFVAQYKLDNFQFGFLAEQYEPVVGDSKDAFMFSTLYSLNDKFDLKGQFGVSDIRAEGGESWDIGADYKMSKTVKTFAYYTRNVADSLAAFDDDYLGVGIEIKF